MDLKAGISFAVFLGIIIIISILLFGIINYLPLKTERLIDAGNTVIPQYADDWAEPRLADFKSADYYPAQLFGDTLVIYNPKIVVKYDTVTFKGKEVYHE